MPECNGRTKSAYRANFRYCYVSPDQFGLKQGDWYTASELEEASGIRATLIANRIYAASYISARCNIVRDEQLVKRVKFERKMFSGYALERWSDWFSSYWLSKKI
mgnify:FL=1